jgi:hypothetical protein
VSTTPKSKHDAPSLETYAAFIEFLRDPDSATPALSPKRFSAAVNIDLRTLAEYAGAHRNTLSRAPNSGAIQDFLQQAMRVIKAATELQGDLRDALFWYRIEPLSAFGYRTAERLVAEGRTDDLLSYIASLQGGAAG